MDLSDLTPIQRKMMGVLSDGSWHSVVELHRCLNDDMGSLTNVRAHLTAIRKVIRPLGEEIACVNMEGTTYYMHSRVLASPYSE